jgi:hypothetical protein
MWIPSIKNIELDSTAARVFVIRPEGVLKFQPHACAFAGHLEAMWIASIKNVEQPMA